MVSRHGIKVDLKKIETVQSRPIPSAAIKIKSLLGLVGYYCRFIDGFSSIAALLTKSTQTGNLFRLFNECEKSFQKLKIALTIAPLLVSPSRSVSFIVYYDALWVGIGCANPEEDPQNFIEEMHKTLRVMPVTEIQGVELVAYRLKGVAYSWFELWKDSHEERIPPARWSEVADAFIDHFLPTETRVAHAAEFENLKQGKLIKVLPLRFKNNVASSVF
uniref:Retrotransposon gag domain-containing protein n=1 Tax=Nicotiana tabacum TaxID=4097 RepID=A0A1S4DGV8_TOBAC|nr:PREDICTED: uncharacterized protein LOC107829763 [Nicotiana tabacum]